MPVWLCRRQPEISKDCAALFAYQKGLCMVPRRIYIGWWLLATAVSLCWLGCSAVRPQLPVVQAPEAAPPLQIPGPAPAPTSADSPIPDTPDINRRATLLPPLPERLEPLPQARLLPPSSAASEPLRTLHRLAVERMAATPAYVAHFTRREMVDGTARPEEIIVFKYRRDPFSIFMRWIGTEAKGRELLYVKGQADSMINVAPAPTDTGKLAPSGRPTLVVADSPQGLGKERYPVGETGIAGLIERFGHLIDAIDRNDPKLGVVKNVGKVKRPEFEAELDAVIHLIPPGFDSGLPKGGQRLWFFDSVSRFPLLVIAHDAQGQEAEYYLFSSILFPGVIRETDFNPANLGRH
jgi:hypothetical protein